MELLTNQVRLQYRLLNHQGWWTQLHAQDTNNQKVISRVLVNSEKEIIEWAKEYHGRGHLFIGRNPRDSEGKVCRITTVSLDIDPVRPKNTASSDEAHCKAIQTARRILQRFRGGSLCSSGNGALILYPVAPVDTDAIPDFVAWCRQFEATVRQGFDTDEVKIDETFDAARLLRLLGSKNTKGTDPKRWRYARFYGRNLVRAERPRIPYGTEGITVQQSAVQDSPIVVSSADSADRAGALQSGVALRDEVQGLGPSARLELAEKSLKRLKPSRADNYDDWLKCGIALKEFGPAGLRMWIDWSKKSAKYNPGDCESKFRTFRADQSITVGTLKYWADQDDPTGGVRSQLRTGTLLPGVPLLGASGERPKLWTPGQPVRGSGEGREEVGAIGTRFKWLDGKLNGGYRPGVVYAVEACTNVGKSQFIVQTAEWCCKAGRKVLLVTTEASIEEVCQRYWACGTGIPCSQISSGSLPENRRRELERYQENFRTNHKLGIWYTVSPKTQEIEELINEFKPDIVLWDYFQHFETGTESRQIQLGSLARWFESISIRTDVPFVVAAQLHERFDFKNRKRVPSIKDDIKDCKVLNDAAKTVIVLDWDYREQQTEHGPVTVRMSLDKNKGPMGETKILLRRDIPRFEEI